jgi:hypothetical protein
LFDFRMNVGSRLADVPFAWAIDLDCADVLVVYADMRGMLEDRYVYDLMLDGEPVALMPVLHGPADLLEAAYTHLAVERPGGQFDWSAAKGAMLTSRPDAWRIGLESGHELVAHANNHIEGEREHLFTLDTADEGPDLPVLLVSRRLVRRVQREELPYMWLHEN